MTSNEKRFFHSVHDACSQANASPREPQGEERVVLDLHVPERGAQLAELEVHVAGQEAGEVDEVDPLVDQLAPAGDRRVDARHSRSYPIRPPCP